MFAIGDGQPIKVVARDNWESAVNLKLSLDKWRSMGKRTPAHPDTDESRCDESMAAGYFAV